MPYLIDGHNLIGRMPGISLKDLDDEKMLISRLQSFYQQVHKPMEVFFDQAPPGMQGRRKYGMLTVVFVRKGKTADDAIRDRLRQLGKTAANWVVVSSDRQVQGEAHSHHASVISSDEFARQVLVAGHGADRGGSDKPVPPQTEDEMQDWLDLFSRNRPGPRKE